MKIVRTIFLVFFLILINVSNTWAETTPPSPPKSAKTASVQGVDDEEPCPTCDVVPPLPIDEHLLLLGVSAVLLGATVIFRQRIIKKALAKS